ncbi:DUF192 domain-containing protein [bacterium]|nr:DUF192 domain-containing protein [bacterium]MBT6832169.1 DUF192 domain-containing protein [bacterium]MBT6996385.1 DUF192 domain-containing protein [bacterium]MBT7772120.1 DUF192 domain-containing protein [bacterium]
MKKVLSLIIVSLFFVGCEFSSTKISLENPAVQIGGQTFTVEIADTPDSRTMGLMNRHVLPQNGGMLFVFDAPKIHSFWMKNTLIPLDVIWISSEKKVVDFQKLLPCESEPCPIYSPSEKSQWVLEIGADQFSGKIGDAVIFPPEISSPN